MVAIASRVRPSLPLGSKRCNAAVSQPFCRIHRKCVSTVCWSSEENSVAGPPLLRAAYPVWWPPLNSVMSGQALIAWLLGEGGCDQF